MTDGRLLIKATCDECGSRRVTAPAKTPFPYWWMSLRMMFGGPVELNCESCGNST